MCGIRERKEKKNVALKEKSYILSHNLTSQYLSINGTIYSEPLHLKCIKYTSRYSKFEEKDDIQRSLIMQIIYVNNGRELDQVHCLVEPHEVGPFAIGLKSIDPFLY